jgi:hypothetical protein
MGILDIVDRILLTLFRRQSQIKIQVAIGARIKKKYLAASLPTSSKSSCHTDESPCPFGHPHLLSMAQEGN